MGKLEQGNNNVGVDVVGNTGGIGGEGRINASGRVNMRGVCGRKCLYNSSYRNKRDSSIPVDHHESNKRLSI